MYLQSDESSGGTSRPRLGAPSWALPVCLRRCRPHNTLRLAPRPPAGCRRPPRLCAFPPPPSCARPCRPHPPPPHSRPTPARPPASPGGVKLVAPPYLAPHPPPRWSHSSRLKRRARRAGEGRRRNVRLLLREGDAPISPPAPGSAPAVFTLPPCCATARPLP